MHSSANSTQKSKFRVPGFEFRVPPLIPPFPYSLIPSFPLSAFAIIRTASRLIFSIRILQKAAEAAEVRCIRNDLPRRSRSGAKVQRSESRAKT
jgi:hypothetical protein